jgi:hypothetical protein
LALFVGVIDLYQGGVLTEGKKEGYVCFAISRFHKA